MQVDRANTMSACRVLLINSAGDKALSFSCIATQTAVITRLFSRPKNVFSKPLLLLCSGSMFPILLVL